ncbi:gamma-glutamyltransferase [Actinomadura verrucosospora]|uniref:Gamma-glutamyltransferase n=1 Tax=Actinomadura verrucosospora TaxID=46165 RepID=A0A7D3ZKJ9_ACTVE|nr:gamma-glutamyltransferase [Actinomadura verrucosospora]QKG22241.1 gamma-glutamyltransferase [Actinomadura verrucosospora]
MEQITGTADRAMICTADPRASSAGLAILRAGGSAADAAVAANAVLAVVAPHRCGLGGDLFALVQDGPGPPAALDAAGRAGSGADAAALRAEGRHRMPVRHDVRSVTVPGCVDGWLALHARHGRTPLAEVLKSAVLHAERGFTASPGLVAACRDAPGGDGLAWPSRPGEQVKRPGIARALRAVVAAGRDGFYRGEFGDGLLRLGRGLFAPSDLAEPGAAWVRPLGVRAFGHDVWTAPPPSPGHVLLAALALAAGLGLPDPADPGWPHLLAESVLAASCEPVDAEPLRPERLAALRAAIDPARHRRRRATVPPGDTACVCVVDDRGMAIALQQSNGTGLGSLLVEPGTGINLHNRGAGFTLAPGSAAEYGPRRRPPHTLVPVLATRPDGTFRAVLGCAGGGIQPQVALQILVRLLGGAAPRDALAAPRWRLAGGLGPFEAPQGDTPIRLDLQAGAPAAWARRLPGRGHVVRAAAEGEDFGEAQLIEAGPGGGLRGDGPCPFALPRVR